MDVVGIIHDREETIRSEFAVKSIGVFGSFARGEESAESDVDILVEFMPGGKTFDNFMDLKYFLEDLLGRRVDLVTVQALRPRLKERILRDVVYA